MAKKLTSTKARKILHDKEVHGHPLTDKQRKFFGAIAGGAKPYKAESGGWLDKYVPKAQNGIEGTMGGLTDIGFNYNGAWGGPSMQDGGKLTTDSIRHQADKILKYEQLRGGPGGTPLPYYSDPKYMDMLMNKVYPEVKKILPNASAMEAGEAMDFIFNAGWDQASNKITKDPRAYALQEYYRQYDKSNLDQEGKWAGRKNAPYSFDQEYNATIGKLPENERRVLMNRGRDWYYRNINNPSPGVPNTNYYDTWYGRIWNTNDYQPFDPKNPKFIPKKQDGGNLMPAMAGANQTVSMAQFGKTIPTFTLAPIKTVIGSISDLFGLSDEPKTKPESVASKSAPSPSVKIFVSSEKKSAPALKMLKVKDPRTIRETTGEKINPNIDLVTGEYPINYVADALTVAKQHGLSKDDLWNLATIALQESKWGKTDLNLGHILGDVGRGDTNNEFVNAYINKMKEADRLGITNPTLRLQVYNGLGTVKPETEEKYHGFKMKKIYGVPVPAEGINMRKNPLYGKQITDIRENVLKKNPEVVNLIESIDNKKFQMGGSLPGAVGFTYARTVGAAPANGPYAKKTKASAQDGAMMRYYQEGLDFKPKTISKNGGWLDKYDKAQTGKTLITKADIDNRSRGDISSYFPAIKKMQEKPKMDKAIAEAEKKRKQKQAEELSRKAIENQPTIGPAKPDYRTAKEKAAQRNEMARAEAMRNSALAQTFGSFTPSGSPDIGVIGAENFVNMNPLITGPFLSGTRLYGQASGQNPYGFGESTVGNVLGAVGLLGDVAFVKSAVPSGTASQVGKYLTTQTPIKNTYKLNPFAEKLRDANKSYRVAGKNAYKDFVETGTVTSKTPTPEAGASLSERIAQRPTGFPSFQKGFADLRYLPEEGGVVFETNLPTYKRGDINPVTGKRIKGSHYAHRVIDPKTGKAVTSIPASDVKVYEGTPDWLRGFREIKDDIVAQKSSGKLPPPPPEPGLTLLPRGNYLEGDLVAGKSITLNDVDKIAKKEMDWLQSAEYFKRRSAATGESASEIQKDVDKMFERWKNINVSANKTSKNIGGYYSNPNNRIVISDRLKSREEGLSTLDHEVKHALSQLGGLKYKGGYTNYPTTEVGNWLTKLLDYKNTKYYAEPWEQQVRGLRLLDYINETQGIPRGTKLSIEDIDEFARSVSPSTESGKVFWNNYDDVGAQLIKMKDADKSFKFIPSNIKQGKFPFKFVSKDNLRQNILDWANKVYAVPGAVGVGAAALGSDEEVPKKQYGGDIPVDPDGYWNPENWGNPVIIPSNIITMEGVDQPLMGISDTGDVQYMEPGEDYEFEGEYVTEYPVAKKGISVNNADAQPNKKLDQLLNFTNYNKPTKGGWLDKYN